MLFFDGKIYKKVVNPKHINQNTNFAVKLSDFAERIVKNAKKWYDDIT